MWAEHWVSKYAIQLIKHTSDLNGWAKFSTDNFFRAYVCVPVHILFTLTKQIFSKYTTYFVAVYSHT